MVAWLNDCSRRAGTDAMWFGDWTSLARVVIATVIAYGYMLSLVRLGGKRTISKKNASDFVITIAIGSTVATVVLDFRIPLADGLVALGSLFALQFLVVTLSTRWERARRIIEGKPRLLYFKGRFMRGEMLGEEVNDSEVLQAIRNGGHSCLDDVYAVVLEIDGSFSVIPRGADRPTALVDVLGVPDEERASIRRREAS